MQVAILDDDEAHNDLVAGILKDAGYRCVTFTRPATFLAELRRQTFDLLVIDWTMPGISGVEVVEQLSEFISAPMSVLMVTSRSSEGEIVAGLSAGADDYVVKPLSPSVLLARVKALLRRTYPSAGSSQSEEFGVYRFEPMTETVLRSGKVEVLTAKEFQLALLLFRNLSRPLSRDYLLQRIWGRRPDLETRTLDAHVSRLRGKLALRPANGFRLVTVYGFGYRLETCEPQSETETD
jgi:DNA-binding response OmpR family regulator